MKHAHTHTHNHTHAQARNDFSALLINYDTLLAELKSNDDRRYGPGMSQVLAEDTLNTFVTEMDAADALFVGVDETTCIKFK